MRRVLAASLVAVLAACAQPEQRPEDEAPPNFDAFADSTLPSRRFDAGLAESLAAPGKAIHVEPKLGVPTFLWAGVQGDVARTATVADAARAHAAEYAPLYGYDDRIEIARIDDRGRGPIIVDFRQRVGGVEVFRDSLKVMMNRNREAIAISGYLTDAAVALEKQGGPVFSLDATHAIAESIRDLRGEDIDTARVSGVGTKDEYESFELLASGKPGAELTEPARTRQVLFHAVDRLIPAWYVEVSVAIPATTDSHSFAYVVSAEDGAVLFRKNLVETDAYGYRVWAHPTDYFPYDGPQGNDPTPHPSGTNDGYQAPFVSSNLLVLDNTPFSRGDDWLFDGSTETSGNNVDAYVDFNAPDGFSAGDFRAVLTTSGNFDYTMDLAVQPSANANQRQAAITQLFYNINWMHDWYYDAGFDEASGNAQAFNFGRGGLENDPIKGEAHDSSGRNNANMNTPSDGGRPRMQMFLFDGLNTSRIEVTAPAPQTFNTVGTASFGPLSFDVTADFSLTVPANACDTITNGAQVAGKIAFIDRGGTAPGGAACGFQLKALNAQAAGAVGVIIGNIS